MDKEIKKWKKKHAEAIRASMANPGVYKITLDHLHSVIFCLLAGNKKIQ